MIEQHYRFLPTRRNTQFLFESNGNNGKILKIVVFTPLGYNRWNLGFGDLQKGEIDSHKMTNNHDAIKVFKTVAKTIFIFLETYPDSIVVIDPADEKRKKVYNAVFQRYAKEIDPIFCIYGLISNEIEVYSLNKIYDYFEITIKHDN